MFNAVKFSHTPDITVINQRQFEEHYSLYKNYITSINELTYKIEHATQEILEDANTINGCFRSLKRGEIFSLNAVILHELYFRNIGGCKLNPPEMVKTILERDFGSFENWEKEFIAVAKSSRGWAVLYYDQRSDRLRNISMDAHDEGALVLGLPILVLDMYEHAYFIQYGTKKVEYIDAFMNNIHWDIILQRMRYYNIC